MNEEVGASVTALMRLRFHSDSRLQTPDSRLQTPDSRLLIMKAKIYVTLKPSVLDPQGKAIHHAVETIGYRSIADVRQGKYFEITLDSAITPEEAREEIERMAKDVLANPVIEDYRVELDSEGEA